MYSIENKKRDIFRSYELKRHKAVMEADNRKEVLYKQFPELQRIEDEINKVGLSLTKKVLFQGVSKEVAKEICDKEMAILKEQRVNVYKKNGIPMDYTEPKYECKECEDTGLLNDGARCSCFEQQLLEDVYMLSNMNVLMKSQNFENMRIDVYSKEVVNGKSQRGVMKENVEAAYNFIQNFENEKVKSLLFYGPTGSGKTFLSSCIAKSVLDRGKTVVYTTISELIELARVHIFGEVSEKVDEKYEVIKTCDLLIIDDLGTELVNKFVVSELYKIINTRMVTNKKVIISTNLNPSEMYSIYTSRVFDRMLEGYKILEFVGPSIRRAKLD